MYPIAITPPKNSELFKQALEERELPDSIRTCGSFYWTSFLSEIIGEDIKLHYHRQVEPKEVVKWHQKAVQKYENDPTEVFRKFRDYLEVCVKYEAALGFY